MTSGPGSDRRIRDTRRGPGDIRQDGGGRAAIDQATDSQFMAPWTLKDNGQEVFTMPKLSVVRAWVFNHAVHHRGQLSVYLRLNDVPVPSIYGPSADEAS